MARENLNPDVLANPFERTRMIWVWILTSVTVVEVLRVWASFQAVPANQTSSDRASFVTDMMSFLTWGGTLFAMVAVTVILVFAVRVIVHPSTLILGRIALLCVLVALGGEFPAFFLRDAIGISMVLDLVRLFAGLLGLAAAKFSHSVSNSDHLTSES
ncbi:MAG: hypothetical protein AMXMBFR82_07230 [Candidatus Hydrogenedentota bacterium]